MVCDRMSPKLKDISGQRFGRLTVIERAESPVNKSSRGTGSFWLCKCDCGNTCIVRRPYLIRGCTKSCGCLFKEHHGIPQNLNGLSKHPLYSVWTSMRDRVKRQNLWHYKYYGGRGIKVCTEWDTDFLAFYNWAITHGYEQGLELNRINNDGDYCPDNCEFTTEIRNKNNRSNTIYVEYKGRTQPLSDWCRELNLPRDTIYWRLHSAKWDVNRAFETPIAHKKK